MATKITLTINTLFDDQLAGISPHSLHWLMMDAFAEFIASRAEGQAQAYVDKRYPLVPGCAYPEGPRREAKVKAVAQRFKWAEALHASQVISIEHVEEVDL